MCIASASSYQRLFVYNMFDEYLPLMQLLNSSTILVLEESQVKQNLPARPSNSVSHVFFKSQSL